MKPCELQFVCDQTWDSLTPTRSKIARYCGDCKKAVFMVKTESQFNISLTLGRCVGIADDNDFIGLVGEPKDGYDWMEYGYFIDVVITLNKQPNLARLEELRLYFPILFDSSKNEKKLRDGETVILDNLRAIDRQQLIEEFSLLAPELEIVSQSLT